MAAEVEQIKKAVGRGIDVTLDCAGFEKTVSTAFGATRNGGKVCLIGMGHCNMNVPLTPAASRYVLHVYITIMLVLIHFFHFEILLCVCKNLR